MCNRLPEINKNGDAGIFPVYYSLKRAVLLERTVATERATKGHTNDTHQEDGRYRCQALASDSLRSSTIV